MSVLSSISTADLYELADWEQVVKDCGYQDVKNAKIMFYRLKRQLNDAELMPTVNPLAKWGKRFRVADQPSGTAQHDEKTKSEPEIIRPEDEAEFEVAADILLSMKRDVGDEVDRAGDHGTAGNVATEVPVDEGGIDDDGVNVENDETDSQATIDDPALQEED
ncbi:MAG: hypothetical protein M1816_000755 [Peltula sp. TS41687]|nr:MAG: hypothetical protein M1816_000755 [Peltula sp. TS41687]